MTLSTAQLIEAMRTVAIAADTEQGREKLNAIANRMEMLVAANADMDLQLNTIRAALNIPADQSVQFGVIDAFARKSSEITELTEKSNRLRRTAKEHQEENQLLRTELAVSQPCNVPNAIDAAVDEVLAIDTVASTAAIKSLFHQYTGKMRLDAAAQTLPVVPDAEERNAPGVIVAVHVNAGDFVRVKDQVFEVAETDFDDHDVTLWFIGGEILKCAAGAPIEVVERKDGDA
ncbi:hypothetical protein ACULN0_03845 [Pectobacterium actinidiae]|uniref:hypothetical protein n=1 Tax=Pectobacterium actinidiae TaxID=1507808 RepID=UPI0040408560